MIDVKKLTASQIRALEVMEDFNCHGICCADCPFNLEVGCGSELARDILIQYEEETRQ